MSDIIERILYLVDNSNKTASDILTELELSKSSISEWKKRKAKPSTDAVIKFAQYFGVSTDYLLLGKEENTVVQIGDNADLSTDEADLLSYFRELPRSNQRSILVQMENMINQEKEQSATKQGKYLA